MTRKRYTITFTAEEIDVLWRSFDSFVANGSECENDPILLKKFKRAYQRVKVDRKAKGKP